MTSIATVHTTQQSGYADKQHAKETGEPVGKSAVNECRLSIFTHGDFRNKQSTIFATAKKKPRTAARFFHRHAVHKTARAYLRVALFQISVDLHCAFLYVNGHAA